MGELVYLSVHRTKRHIEEATREAERLMRMSASVPMRVTTSTGLVFDPVSGQGRVQVTVCPWSLPDAGVDS